MAAAGGGSWKVAYADFVTAMMAFFMVMWLTSQDQRIKESIEAAFVTRGMPNETEKAESGGLLPNDSVQQIKDSEGNFDSVQAIELMILRQMAQKILAALSQDPLVQENEEIFELQILSDGVMVSIFDRAKTPLFKKDSAEFTQYGNWVIGGLAWVLEQMDSFSIELAGHTVQGPNGVSGSDDVWAISVDRAKAARTLLVRRGLASERIDRISGFGDSKPMKGFPPTSEANRRIDIHLRIGQN